MRIETGDILMVLDGQHVIADAIKLVTASRAHHCGVFRDENTVSEMEAKGHVLTDWRASKYRAGRTIDRTLILMKPKEPFTDEEKEEIRAFIDTNDSRYDFLALLKHIAYRKYGIWVGRRTARAANRMTCSEWTGFLYNNFTGLWKIWYKAAPVDIMVKHIDKFDYFCFRNGKINPVSLH